MTPGPSLDNFVSRSSHAGPLWRHQPSIREWLIIGVLWAFLVATLGTFGALPDPPFDPGEWIANLAIGVGAVVPAFVVVELFYHRLIRP